MPVPKKFLDRLLVDELKELCRKKGKTVGGNKPDLVSRLGKSVDFEDLTKEMLKNLCDDLELPVGGNKSDLIARLTGTSSGGAYKKAKVPAKVPAKAHAKVQAKVPKEMLYTLLVDDLKALCHKKHQTVGGNKGDLVNRLDQSVDFVDLTLEMLKDLCYDLELPVGGNKSDLIARLLPQASGPAKSGGGGGTFAPATFEARITSALSSFSPSTPTTKEPRRNPKISLSGVQIRDHFGLDAQKVLKLYTKNGDLFSQLNRVLRSSNAVFNPKNTEHALIVGYVGLLTRAIREWFDDFGEGTKKVYRGVKCDPPPYALGVNFDRGFLSFSEKIEVARHFAGPSGWIIELHLNPGRRRFAAFLGKSTLSHFPDEREILLAPNSQLRIHHVDHSARSIMGTLWEEDWEKSPCQWQVAALRQE